MQIQEIAGIPIDHSFLKYKKELASYGYQVTAGGRIRTAHDFPRCTTSGAFAAPGQVRSRPVISLFPKLPDVAGLVEGFHFESYVNTLLKDLSTGNRKKVFLMTAFALNSRLQTDFWRRPQGSFSSCKASRMLVALISSPSKLRRSCPFSSLRRRQRGRHGKYPYASL